MRHKYLLKTNRERLAWQPDPDRSAESSASTECSEFTGGSPRGARLRPLQRPLHGSQAHPAPLDTVSAARGSQPQTEILWQCNSRVPQLKARENTHRRLAIKNLSFQNASEAAYGLHAHSATADSEEKRRALNTGCLVVRAVSD